MLQTCCGEDDQYPSHSCLIDGIRVEQPVGTGYTIGTPVAHTEEEISQDFVGFLKNFQLAFGIQNFKIYVTGESAAGRYVPYISAALLDEKNEEYFNLKGNFGRLKATFDFLLLTFELGAMVYDPTIGGYQQQIPVLSFIQNNNDVFKFNKTFIASIEALHTSCGYKDF